MKTRLLTALALAGALAFADTDTDLQPPSTVVPDRINVSAVGDTVSLRFSIPNGTIGNKFSDVDGISAKDGNGGETRLQGFSNHGLSEAEQCLTYFGEVEGDTLEFHHKFRFNTGDGVRQSAPVILSPGQSGCVEIGGASYEVSYIDEGWRDEKAGVCFRLKPCGEHPDVLLVNGDRFVFIEPAGDAGLCFDIRVPRGCTAAVRALSLVNPRPVEVSADYLVHKAPMFQIRCDMPEGCRLGGPVFTGMETSTGVWTQEGGPRMESEMRFRMETVEQGWEILDDNGYIGREAPVLVGGKAPAGGVVFLSHHVSCKPNMYGADGTKRYLELVLAADCPQDAEGDAVYTAGVQVDVARFHKPEKLQLVADGSQHSVEVEGCPFTYIATFQDGCWRVECSYTQSLGEKGVDITFENGKAYRTAFGFTTSSVVQPAGITHVERSLSIQPIVDRAATIPPSVNFIPYTDRRTITIPVEIRGRFRSPFIPLGK